MTQSGRCPKHNHGAQMVGRVTIILILAIFGSYACADQQPNIVLIVTDNQSELLLGSYGNRDVKTPNSM